MMAPKELAAAVLATLPLEAGVIGGEIIRDVTYVVILVSISLTDVLVMIYPNRLSQIIYARILNKAVHPKNNENNPLISGNIK
jgi:NhaP-type Na+/H+ and K+/H+ antiporter